MRLFESDANPEAYAFELWHSLLPARPIEGCPGVWEVKGQPGERGCFRHFGVDPGEELALADAFLQVQVRRYDERAPRSLHGGAGLILWYPIPARMGRHIYSMMEAVVTPCLPGNAASLIVTVWDELGHLVEGAEVRAR